MARKRSSPASMIGLGWEDVGKLSRNAKAMDDHIDGLQRIWTYWLGKGGTGEGGRLTRKMANDFKEYVRAKMISQEAFAGSHPLSPFWIDIKSQMELPYDPYKIGFATGTLYESISTIDQGGGKFRVGITKRTQNTTTVSYALPGEHEAKERPLGNITNVAQYAYYLEYGRRNQPPRPFFGVSFRNWLDENYPEVAKPLIAQMNKEIRDLFEIADQRAPRATAEDLVSEANVYGDAAYEEGGAAWEITQTEQVGGTGTGKVTPGEDIAGAGLADTDIGDIDAQTELKQTFDKTLNTWVRADNKVWDQKKRVWKDYMEYINELYGDED